MSAVTEITSFLIAVVCLHLACTQGSQVPLWKDLLVRYPSWRGYMEDNNTRYITSFRTLSVQKDEFGLALVKFTSQDFSIEMEVSSVDDKTVHFKEETVWNKEASFKDHSSLEFKGQFVWDKVYYKLLANVSSSKRKDFARLTLVPEGHKSSTREKKNDSSKVGLYVGIPVVLAFVVLGLGALVLYWGFRKGYLRHVPWSYRAFGSPENSTKDLGLDLSKDQAGVEKPAVHI